MPQFKRRTEGAVIGYRLSGLTPSQHTRFAEKVLGQDRKKGGRTYRRRGLLDGLPHWRVNHGMLVTRAEDRVRVVKAIREWTPEVVWWSIPLTGAQLRRVQKRLKGF